MTIGSNGKVRCNVSAREVVILGNCHGNIDATEKLEVRKDASVVGELKTARLVIEDGAYFKGSIDVVKPEPPNSVLSFPPRPQPTAAAAIPANSHSAALAGEFGEARG